MKNIKFIAGLFILSTMVFSTSCKDDFLKEDVLDRFSPENLLVDKAGFETAITALHAYAREEHLIWGGLGDEMSSGTDVSTAGVSDTRFLNDYTTLTPEYSTVTKYWDWCYTKLVKQSNLIIDRADSPEVAWENQSDKEHIIAEARFFRAYTYNVMVHLFGGIPLANKEYREPKFDFERATKIETLEFIENDLKYATQYLPVPGEPDGRIYKAAAYHLLTEVYLALGIETNDASYFDKAIAAASKVIDTSDCGTYKLMTERFGDIGRPGDVFSDIFWTNQQNRASGNLEVIWALQFELYTNGGSATAGANTHARIFGPSVEGVKTPDGKHTNIACDSIVRCAGITAPLNYVKYDIWGEDWNDMRNSPYNIRRDWYYNNPLSSFLGEKVIVTTNNGKVVVAMPDGTPTTIGIDTTRAIYPMHRKVDGISRALDPTSGTTVNDLIRMRLAETYLLRAEAHIRKGDIANAAIDINTVRARAKAKPVEASRVDIDYLLDERARELYIEEPRRIVLSRMGLLYERSVKYNYRASATMKPFNALFPIPQKAIDANKLVKIKQNPGYPGADN